MNFQNLAVVERYTKYLEAAVGKGDKAASLIRAKSFRDRLTKSKEIEKSRMKKIMEYLRHALLNIVTCFPSYDSMPIFYKRLMEETIDKDVIKQYLSMVDWSAKKITELHGDVRKKIQREQEVSKISTLRRSFVGRINSIMKKLDKQLVFLEKARKIMRKYPAVKTGLFTICIAGFPNAGKSTLLSKITTAKPEIKAYAFTTKILNIGYFEHKHQKVQVIDTPGTLNRPEKMNMIEKQAYLAMKYLSDLIVFVFDPIDDLKKQEKLLEKIREYDKEIIVYMSKADMIDEVPGKLSSCLADANALVNSVKQNIDSL